MKCPVCENTDLLMSERNGVEIDYCPKCRGVWLDRGELDKIIEFNSQNAPSYAPQSTNTPHAYNQYEKPQGYYKNKPYKKKSFLSEIFDF